MEKMVQRKKTIEIQPGNRFAEAVVSRCSELEWTIRDLSMKTEMSYEALRKIIRGVSNTSRLSFNILVEALGLDKKEMDELVTMDRVQKKYGTSVSSILKKDPAIVPFELVIPNLTSEQRDQFLLQMQSIALDNRRKAKKVGESAESELG